MKHYDLESFNHDGHEMDSLYRLVNIAFRRAHQINKPENRPLITTSSRKPTIIALEEILDGKVGYRIGEGEEDDYEVG